MIDNFWGVIYNTVTVFEKDVYKHRFRNSWSKLKRIPLKMHKIERYEFMQHVKQAKYTAPGLDGRNMEELKALPPTNLGRCC